MSVLPKEGFEPLFRSSPFLDHNGSFFQKRTGSHLVVGINILDKHVNGRGYAHAGILMTLADIAIGYQSAFSEEPPLNLVTISLSSNFLSTAQLGDWLEAHVEIVKKGRNLVHANAQILKGEELVLQSNAVYRIIQPKTAS